MSRIRGADRRRLRDCRRRLGRLRDGGAPVRKPAHACCCWKPAATTGTSGSTCRSATARPSPTRGSTGATRPSRTRTQRSSRLLAARQGARRFVVDQRPGLHPRPAAKISTSGASSAIPAGGSTMSCRISAGPNTRRAARVICTAPAARSACPTWTPTIRSARPSSRRRKSLGFPRNDDFNGAVQEGVGYYQDHHAQRPPLLHRCRLSAAGNAAAQPARHHQCAQRADHCSTDVAQPASRSARTAHCTQYVPRAR